MSSQRPGPRLLGPRDLVDWLRWRPELLEERFFGVLLDRHRQVVDVWVPRRPGERPLLVPAVDAAVVVVNRAGQGVTARPEDIVLWRIWFDQAPDDLPLLDVLLLDGHRWSTLGVFDEVLG